MDGIIDIIGWMVSAPFICCGWLVIGFLAGGIARYLTGGKDRLFINDMILGLAGAVVGGFIAGLFSIDADSSSGISQMVVSFVIAIGGAVVLIYIGRTVFGARAR